MHSQDVSFSCVEECTKTSSKSNHELQSQYRSTLYGADRSSCGVLRCTFQRRDYTQEMCWNVSLPCIHNTLVPFGAGTVDVCGAGQHRNNPWHLHRNQLFRISAQRADGVPSTCAVLRRHQAGRSVRTLTCIRCAYNVCNDCRQQSL